MFALHILNNPSSVISLRKCHLLLRGGFYIGEALSVDEVFELFASAGVTEFAKSFCFDLTDTFAGYVEFLTNFLKGSGAAVIKTETEAKNFFFSGGKGFKNVAKLLFKKSVGSGVCRCRCIIGVSRETGS